jgi:hypothetical protein
VAYSVFPSLQQLYHRFLAIPLVICAAFAFRMLIPSPGTV